LSLRACLIVVAIGRGRGPLKALLVPLFAAFGTFLSAVGGDVGWRLPVAARGRLPASLGRVKCDHLIASGALGGNAAWLLERVPKEVAMYTLPWALCVAIELQARAALVSLGLSMSTLGQEICEG
jgi:hypothetical protein